MDLAGVAALSPRKKKRKKVIYVSRTQTSWRAHAEGSHLTNGAGGCPRAGAAAPWPPALPPAAAPAPTPAAPSPGCYPGRQSWALHPEQHAARPPRVQPPAKDAAEHALLGCKVISLPAWLGCAAEGQEKCGDAAEQSGMLGPFCLVRGTEHGLQETVSRMQSQGWCCQGSLAKEWHACMDVPRETARTETSRAPCAASAAPCPAAVVAAYAWHRGLRVNAAMLNIGHQALFAAKRGSVKAKNNQDIRVLGIRVSNRR